jgi:ribosomal protein S18 acetylase RimI-like enzyme
MLEEMEGAHPRYPHWYLPWIGVEPSKQNQQRGSQLLESCLEYIDVGGLPVFLETSNTRSVAFFTRQGFEVTGQTTPGPIPPQTFMIRPGARG